MSGNDEELQDLIRKLGSRDYDTAWKAVSLLDAAGWLKDGSLEGAQLSHANLKGASLFKANLRGVNLADAFLQSADLFQATLEGANLAGVYLQGADLSKADLRGADLSRALLDEGTVLPDGTNWTPGTDVSRFTDPNHPEFWRSDDPDSPAYGREE